MRLARAIGAAAWNKTGMSATTSVMEVACRADAGQIRSPRYDSCYDVM
jgi:hypothetical protein